MKELSPEEIQVLRDAAEELADNAPGDTAALVGPLRAIAERFDPTPKEPWERAKDVLLSELDCVPDRSPERLDSLAYKRIANAAREGAIDSSKVREVTSNTTTPDYGRGRMYCSGWRGAMLHIRKELGIDA